MVLAAFVASMAGYIPNLQYVREGGSRIRNSFGIVYPTDFAAHILFMMFAYGYLRSEKLQIVEYLIGLTIVGCVYYFCDARNNVLGMLLFIIGFVLINICERLYLGKATWEKTKKILSGLCCVSMIVFMSVMILLTMLYSESNAIWMLFPQTVRSRLIMGQEGVLKYGIHLLGQKIPMVGAGGSTSWPENYFFLDCSYVYILLCYGLLMLILVLLIYFLISMKNKSDLYLLYVIGVIAFVCMFEHHLTDLGYNPFTLALFATINKTYPKNEQINEG